MSATDVQLRAEIKQLLKEASSLSQPSTFAQASKLRRMAAAKEKELAKRESMRQRYITLLHQHKFSTSTSSFDQELLSKEMKLTYDSHVKVLMMLKVCIFSVLILWFWRFPVAAISEQLVHPVGRVLSWRAGGPSNNNVMVGIVPWLIVSTRVGKFVCRKIFE